MYMLIDNLSFLFILITRSLLSNIGLRQRIICKLGSNQVYFPVNACAYRYLFVDMSEGEAKAKCKERTGTAGC